MIKKIIFCSIVLSITNLMFSKYISLSISTTVDKIQESKTMGWDIHLKIKNEGNDDAFGVYPYMILKNKLYKVNSNEHYSLLANNKNEWHFFVSHNDLDLTNDLTNSSTNGGIYPLEFYINYKDYNGKEYNATNIGEINTGNYEKAKFNMKLSSQNVSVKNNNDVKKTKVIVNNNSRMRQQYSFYAISPESIEIFVFSEFSSNVKRTTYSIGGHKRTYYQFSLNPKEKIEIPIKVKNKTNNPASSLFVYYILQKNINSIESFKVVPQRIEIVANKMATINLLGPLIVILVVTLLMLLIIIVFSLIFNYAPSSHKK